MRNSRSSGFTIIEVLVAICVLALGLIGATAMQLAALRTRHQSALLSNAVQLASGMADKMRANAGQMRLGDADNPYLNLQYDVLTDGAPAAPAQLCFAPAICSSAQMADADIYELKQQVRASLPGGRLVICRDLSLWNRGSKSLDWACNGAAGAPVVIKLGWRGKHPDGSALQDARRPYSPGVVLALTGPAP
jgi:type IV pilus assembly protein PilV